MNQALQTRLWQNRPHMQAWVVTITAALFFFYEFVQMNMFSSISAELMSDFGLDAEQLGLLSAAYFYADVLFLLPAGMLLDRFSTRKIILAAMLVCVTGTLVFSVAEQLWLAALCRFLTGIGNAFCFLSCIRLASRWFSAEKMAFVVGLIVTIAMMGGVFAQTPFAMLSAHYGWRHALLINAAFGSFIILMLWLWVVDAPVGTKKSAPAKQEQAEKEVSVWAGLKWSMANGQNWLAGMYTCLLNLAIFLLGALWGGLYLDQVQHLSRTQAGNVTTMVFIGTIIGSPLVGWLSDKIKQRRMPMLLSALVSTGLATYLLYATALSYETLLFLFFLIGFFTSAQIISYPLITESNPLRITGTATGLASVLIMGGGAVFQPLFGWLMDWHWNHLVVGGAPIYAVADFQRGLMILPLAFAGSVLCALCLRETHCRQQH